MGQHQTDLIVARFLDSFEARSLGHVPDLRRAAVLMVSTALDDLGVQPRLLDGDQVGILLLELIVRKLGLNDPLLPFFPAIARAFFSHLSATELMPCAFEIEMRLASIEGDFLEAAQAVRPEQRILGPTSTIREKGSKVGRNEPCPCGSGKKFKQCCMRLG